MAIATLDAAGRNVYGIATKAPGVTTPGGRFGRAFLGSGGGNVMANGTTARSTNYELDGISNIDPEDNDYRTAVSVEGVQRVRGVDRQLQRGVRARRRRAGARDQQIGQQRSSTDRHSSTSTTISGSSRRRPRCSRAGAPRIRLPGWRCALRAAASPTSARIVRRDHRRSGHPRSTVLFRDVREQHPARERTPPPARCRWRPSAP